MNRAQKLARNGGATLVEAMKFVTICRSRDPQNDYPHIGDLQWWCRDGSLDDQQNWHFWYQDNGEALALAVIAGDEIVCLLHPDFRTRERESSTSDAWLPCRETAELAQILPSS